MDEGLLDIWKRREPIFDPRYRDLLFKKFTTYGRSGDKTATFQALRFGSGYDLFIVAFFIGLYSNKRRKLSEEALQRRNDNHFSRTFNTWGLKTGDEISVGEITRKDYSIIPTYMFVALISELDDDYILQLEKGVIDKNEFIRTLVNMASEYANYGLFRLEEIEKEHPDFLSEIGSFYDIINVLLEDNK